MNSDATVFSQNHRIVFEKSLTTLEVEGLLRDFIASIGRALSRNEVILGHIKVLAKLSESAPEQFLFLSHTSLTRVDITPSKWWPNGEEVSLDSLELCVNVLVFGYTMSEVVKVVTEALEDLGGCVYRTRSKSPYTAGGRKRVLY